LRFRCRYTETTNKSDHRFLLAHGRRMSRSRIGSHIQEASAGGSQAAARYGDSGKHRAMPPRNGCASISPYARENWSIRTALLHQTGEQIALRMCP
jgi:hypothetical protein